MQFNSFEIESGVLYENCHDTVKYKILGIRNSALILESGFTYFGVIHSGEITIADKYGEVKLVPGMSFLVNDGQVSGKTDDDSAIIIKVDNYNGLRQFCGPIEKEGRLRFLDDCTDTLIISPAKYGDPCLNHLHIPVNVRQTPHTHPSDRVGIVMKGKAECVTDVGKSILNPGDVWIIPKDQIHSFNTENSSIDLITWHPDSEFGPSDENHPMVNRTEVVHA